MQKFLNYLFPTDASMPRWSIFIIDVLICASSYIFATFLRFNFFLDDALSLVFFYRLPIVLIIRIVFILYFKIYAGIIRHTSIQDAVRVFYTVLLSTIAIGIVNIIYIKYHNDTKVLIPISIIIIDFFGTTLLMSFFRISTKLLYIRARRPIDIIAANYAVFGAGETGILVKRKIEQFANGKIKVVAFFDDDTRKATKLIDGIPIIDSQKDFISTLKNLHIKEIILTPQRISKIRKQEIIESCLNANVHVRNVPPPDKWINGELSFNQIKGVRIEDLIEREEIILDKGGIAQNLYNKTILVTGAAGSIGSEIVRQILANYNPKKLILVDKSEILLYELEAELTTSFKSKYNLADIVIADITSITRMRFLFRSYRPDIVFHAAAYKHVPLMEANVCEAVRVNVMGTKILADLAVEFSCDKFVFVSTDKAVNPTNVMGASKRIAEIYVQSLDKSLTINDKRKTKFITTRFGNVIGSSGSVIPKFRKQIDDGGPVTVTHPEVTRYFMTIPEACQLVLEAGNMGLGGEIYIFDMGKSIRIIDIAKRMIQLTGLKLGEDIQILFTGLRPGEKLKEELLADSENSVATYHPKIMIAKVRNYDFNWVNREIQELIGIYDTQNNSKLVSKMKSIVPEFISQNSIYEALDFQSTVLEEVNKHSRID